MSLSIYPSVDVESIHALQKARQAYLPKIPHLLRDPFALHLVSSDEKCSVDEKIKGFFPLTCGQPLLKGKKGERRETKPLQIGVVLSGGQAAGGHNVIVGIYDSLKLLHPNSRLFGFLDGPGGIVAGRSRELDLTYLDSYRNQGGFDMIGAGRDKIETEEQLNASLATVQTMKLDGLVIIGGDDSNTNAAILTEYFKKRGCATKVIGVPKTIDGDLKNSFVATSFGFDTACKVYSEIIGNIARDAASAKKYYHFIRLMGRSASHVALECALATHPNLVFIGEEIAFKKRELSHIVEEIAELICKRSQIGKHYGVILIPEGLIEFIPEIASLIKELNHILAKDPYLDVKSAHEKLSSNSQKSFSSLPELIQQQLLLNRDSHGNVQVSFIETQRLLMELVEAEIGNRIKKGICSPKFAPIHHFLGYEGRAGYPSNFDCNYCYALGLTATQLISHGATGYMACISDLTKSPQEWGVGGVPLTALMYLEVRKGKEKPVIQKAFVDLNGRPFAELERRRKQWELQDEYCNPGPIQFFGDPSLTEQVPLTLLLET